MGWSKSLIKETNLLSSEVDKVLLINTLSDRAGLEKHEYSASFKSRKSGFFIISSCLIKIALVFQILSSLRPHAVHHFPRPHLCAEK